MLRTLLSLLTLLVFTDAVYAQTAAKWIEGTSYSLVQPAQPVTTPGKIEVLDVFSYACPACNAFQPTLDKLMAALPASAQMAYLPAAFNPSEDWPVFQRAFLTAQFLKVAEKSHDALYDAVWGPNPKLPIIDKASGTLLPMAQQPTIDAIAQFYAAYGVSPADFVATANSFAIDAKIGQAEAKMRAYQVESTPTLIVNGKYLLTPKSAGGYPQTIELVLYLIAKEKRVK